MDAKDIYAKDFLDFAYYLMRDKGMRNYRVQLLDADRVVAVNGVNTFEPIDLISEAYLVLSDLSLELNKNNFKRCIVKAFGILHGKDIEQSSVLLNGYATYEKENKERARRMLSKGYINQLLSFKYSKEYRASHPELAKIYRKYIIAKRKGENVSEYLKMLPPSNIPSKNNYDYIKKYHKENSDRVKKHQSDWYRKSKNMVSDSYVRRILRSNGLSNEHMQLHPEIISEKRESNYC